MTQKIPPIAILFSLLIAISSCNNEKDTNPEVPKDIISRSLDLFSGEVVEQGFSTENGTEAWEIKIQNSQGATIKFYWAVDNQSLVKIEAEHGPYTYDFNPGSGLINFSTAKTFAVSAVKNDAILKWELKQDENFIDDWIYRFEIEGDQDVIKVYVDAKTGDVLQID